MGKVVAANAERLFSACTEEIKKRYRAFEAPCHFKKDGSLDGKMATIGDVFDLFEDTLKAVAYTFVLVTASEYDWMEISGTDDEEKALAFLVEDGESDEKPLVAKWDGKAWYWGKMKRKSGRFEVCWDEAVS